MKLTLLILFIAISLMPSLFSYMKKGMAGKPMMETDGEDDDNGFFGFDEENVAMEPEHVQPQYFTYETLSSEDGNRREDTPVMEESVEEQRVPAFDLRQAVIYQTVLNNQYINTGN